MPSPLHDTINKLFRDHPRLAVDILHGVMGVDVPVDRPVRVESNDFNDRPSKDFQPDTVIVVGSPREPVHGIIVEVQQEKSEAKRRQLPRYAAASWLMLRCPVTVLCVCPDPDAAAWYAEPIETELSGYVFRAVALGPREVPVITDSEAVVAQPELAMLGVMAHGRNRKVLQTFTDALKTVKDDEHALRYYEYAYVMASPAARRVLEEIVSSTDWPVYSPFAKEHYGRGKADGLEEGEAKGEAKGEARSILTILAARQIEVPEDVRARIRGCVDMEQLDAWLRRAAVANSIADLFD
ncbi:hypothetical protein [Actinoallomurus acaciae]|uniref:DUF4365 domain-containing protein n=1 Tax=Actinoallomurus acaciae TaxID=502577 RepID=A0ABV5YEG5_9ACTN